MSAPIVYAPETTHELIQERAKLSSDRFKIQIWRRPQTGGQIVQVAGVDAATVDHITDPARWLPPLMGGGEYVLHVFHSTEQPSVRIGGPLPVMYDSKPGSPFGLPRQLPNMKAMTNEAWTGPKILTYPPMELMTPEEQAPLLGMTPKNGANLQALAGAGLPQQPVLAVDPNIAQRENDLRVREFEMARREKEAAEALARTTRELTEQREANKRAESESKLRDEMRNAQNETKTALAQLTAQLTAPKQGGGVAEIIAALAPLATQLIQSGNDSRLQLAKMQEESNRRREEAEDRRAKEAAQAEDRRAQTQLEIAKLSAVKPGMSEEMKMLLDTLKSEKNSSGTAAMTEMMNGMINAMGTVTKMSINMIETVSDQMGGDPEDPVVTAIKEGTKAMMMLTQGSQNASRSIVPQKPAPQPQARQAAPQQATRAPQQQAQRAPVALPAAPAGATATGPQATAPGVPTAGPATAAPEPSKTDLLEAAIRGQQPPEAVARVLVAMIATKDPSLGIELSKHEGNPNKVLYARLGETWVENNLPYLNELGAQFDAQGIDAGIFTEDDGAEALADEPASVPAAANGAAPAAPSPAEVQAEQ